jgi:hydrogenase maturation protease
VEELSVIESNDSSAGSILVIGFGNTLRGDDGVGQHVAAAVAKWQVSGLSVRAAHQLTPELAEPISRADMVIFVDGQLAGDEDAVTVRRLEPSTLVDCAGHTSDPRGVLALAQVMYGRHAPAWLVLVPGLDFSLREDLSAAADRGVAEAIGRIAALIDAQASGSTFNCGPRCRELLQP